MPELFLPNGNGQPPRSLKRDNDFVTMKECIQLIGPQAQLLVEFNERLAAIEARLGLTAIETDADGPNVSGDVD